MRTLDEAIAQYQEKAEYFKTTTNVAYALELKQISEWLEELKAYLEIGTVEECRNSVLDIEMAYNKGYADGSLSVTSEIRNKVIDECLGVLYRNGGKIISIGFYEEIFDEMKKLKVGGTE